ncbi:MAG: phosphatidate cytidylyltransferase [Chloroflexota bacterium]|nr:phosphatidate cytidylyltransferase [Chloroflexota bacterium]
MASLSPLAAASIVLIVLPAVGLVGALLYAGTRRAAPDPPRPRVILARWASYTVLSIGLLAVAHAGVPGMAILVGVLGVLGLIEWGRLFDLPIHHRISVLVAHVVIVLAVVVAGAQAADRLIGGLVLVGIAWPVVRADTGRAVRDLGVAAVGIIIVSVLLTHGLLLTVELGETGTVLFVALAVACATSDVGAFLVGRRFGHTPLAPRLSPSKTRAGLIGNALGALLGIALFAPALVPSFGGPFVVLLVAIVAAGAVWGDLLESAVKREAGVKDAGSWLPGFGGILDRIDSLLVTVALAYWATRLVGVG